MKKSWVKSVLLAGVMTTAAACAPVDDTAYHKIDAETAKTMLDQETGIVLVDVRRPDEYAQGHIPGAINIPNETIGTAAQDALPNKEATLVVYCRSGVRSHQASDKLVDMGYRAVYDMGGIIHWPYDTVKGDGAK